MVNTLRILLAAIILFTTFQVKNTSVLSQPDPPLDPTATNEIILAAVDLVDLAWDPAMYPHPEQKFMRWELYRGTSPSPTNRVTFGLTELTDFYRDQDVPIGPTYYYALRVVRCKTPCLGPGDEVTYNYFDYQPVKSGIFQGTVTRDLLLKPQEYPIGDAGVGPNFSVTVAEGVTLSVPPEVTLVPAAGLTSSGINVMGGSLFITGANLQDIILNYGDYYDPLVSGQGQVTQSSITGGVISINAASDIKIHQNTGAFSIDIYQQGHADISKNTFEGTVSTESSATADITDNMITNGWLDISGYGAPAGSEGGATLTGNTITSVNKAPTAMVDVNIGAKAILVNNTLQWTGFHGSESTVLLWAAGYSGRTTQVTARGNTIINGKMAATNGAVITYTDNVVKDGGSAITVGCVFCSGAQATGQIEYNTLQGGWGLELWVGSEAVSIHHNCIRGNNPGATLDPFLTSPVDLTNNYWGHASGPAHSTNPGGQGDRIDGDLVNFTPWDTTDANCRGEPPVMQDLTIKGVEIVQSVQSLDDPTPLVAHKPAVLRIYPHSRTTTEFGVRYDVSAFRGANYIGTLEGDTNVYRWENLDQILGRTDKSIFLPLPEDWLEGEIQLKIEINRLEAVQEVDYDNNLIYYTAQFNDIQPLRVLIQPIRHREDAYSQPELPDLSLLPGLPEFAQAGYPVPSLEYTILPPLDWPYEMGNMHPDIEFERAEQLLSSLTRILERYNANRTPAQRFQQINGVFAGFLGDGRISFCISNPAWVGGEGVATYCTNDTVRFAHEIAHNLGRRHTNLGDIDCGAVDDETDWPYSDPYSGAFGYYQTLEAITYPSNYELMTYCFPRWYSPFTYSHLFTALQAMGPVELSSANIASSYVMVGGTITKSDGVTFDPVWQFTDTTPPVNPPLGLNYCLELYDASSVLLSSRCFDLTFTNTETGQPVDKKHFLVSLPWTTGVPHRVVLKHLGSPIGQVTANGNGPSVTLVAPNGGETLGDSVQVQWTSADADGGDLFYNLFYSPDNGISWTPVAVDLKNIQSYTLDLSSLAGSSQARLRVEVSDGFNTTFDDSDASFTVGDHAPLVGISSPLDGARVTPTFRLVGAGWDPEDGALAGASLSWTSSRDGFLGTGAQLAVQNLSEGQHQITLTGTDSQTHFASFTITVEVRMPRIYLPMMRK